MAKRQRLNLRFLYRKSVVCLARFDFAAYFCEVVSEVWGKRRFADQTPLLALYDLRLCC